jgi:hypothetical protein
MSSFFAPLHRMMAAARDAVGSFLRQTGIITQMIVGLVALVFLYLFIGGFIVSRVDDDLFFTPPAPLADTPAGSAAVSMAAGSAAVSMAAGLIDREIHRHGWTANDPFFMPGYYIDNMPNFQQGMMYALSRFAVHLTDNLGRNRGSSQVDPDLDMASGLLKYPGDVWLFDFRTSWIPTASSEAQYKRGLNALLKYNARVGRGEALYEVRADNLIGLLDSIAADLGSTSAIIENKLQEATFFGYDSKADDVFYAAKGRVYGYLMILKAMRQDASGLLRERKIESLWDNMLQSLEDMIALKPLVVLNGHPDGILIAHLTGGGFYIMRARTQLREITNVLAK